ncbi:hypothetical protein BDB00DRAFT_760494 [Zychaea mexicana]|uniref:uncharacterized protein n=1 Tax=Zychaea mexicana TaxID=64656 RepID=UPI0022FE6541|nr:uncharacterized protein BDB00DRAFT_760494 [Zychaea mexicana]KAI9495201.1 hypothetical protein BDB00DRAFT_760494 [Zychaea mexicana]
MDSFKYPEYISLEEIELGVSNGQLYVGILRISGRRRYDAYVSVTSLDDDVYIGSDFSRNRAFDGDVVAIRLKDVDPAWKQRKEAHLKFLSRKGANVDRNPSATDLAEGEEEEESSEEEEDDTFGYKPKYAGEVVGIVERPKERFLVGLLNLDFSQEGNSALEHRLCFRPLDKRMPLCYIPNANGPPDIVENQDHYKSQLLVAKIIGWQHNKKRPVAKIMRVLGEVGDMAVETEAILTDCSIATTPYSEAALSAVPPLPFTIPEAEFSKRSDMREILTFTIDPSTAKDLDDALHIKRLVDGFEVGVHIADVSYFVKANTPLDSEAKERGTSTYLVNRVIPMLPEDLCQNLCSLKAGEDRLAFSIIWKIDKEARVLDTSFCKTMIRSKAQLSYEDAQKVIDGGNIDPSVERAAEIEQAIRDLMELARCRRRRRFGEGGALALDSIKLMFDVDANGEPTAAVPFEHIEAHMLIEEFMLQANISTARKISTTYSNEALLRRHQGPIIRRLNQFVEQARELGFDVKAETSGELQRSFESIPEGEIKQALLALAIRPMQRAKYFCVGTLDIEKWPHYALNEPVYTHFTSPIRRYADIIVHRQLEAAMNNKKMSGYSKKTVQSLSYHCNYRKERAGAAEELSIHLFLSRYLANMASKQPIIESATVISVELDYIDIYHHKYGLKRRLYVEDLPLAKYEFDSDSNTVTWYWKRGALVDMDSYMKRVNKYSSNSSRKQQRGATTNDGIVEASTASKQVNTQLRAPPRQLVPSRLDHEACSQTFAVFSTLDVRLQVNSSRSPPVINTYPVNPFY